MNTSPPKNGGGTGKATTHSKDSPGVTAWHARAEELAPWFLKRLFVRFDRYGGYEPDGKGGKELKTFPKSGPKAGCVNLDLVLRHCRATDTADVIGPHTLNLDDLGMECAVDIDAHEGDGADPEANRRFALAIFAEVINLGFRPLLYSSNGKGGYHLRVLFQELIPGPVLFRFAKWLVRNHAVYGFKKSPETFPKQKTIRRKFGNWLRLPGRHHTRDYWSEVFDGSTWLAGAAAVDHILSITGDPPDLIPDQAKEYDPEPQPKPRQEEPKRRAGVPGVTIFEAFNREQTLQTVADFLCRYEWEVVHKSDDVWTMRRIGSQNDQNGNVKIFDGVPVFYSFTPNTKVPPNEGMNPTQLRATYEFGGTAKRHMADLARALEVEGFEGPPPPTMTWNGEPIRASKSAERKTAPQPSADGIQPPADTQKDEGGSSDSADPPNPPDPPREPDDRAVVILTADLHVVAERTFAALAARDRELFQRAGELVTVLRQVRPPVFLRRDEGAAAFSLVSDDLLAVRCSQTCRFLQQKIANDGTASLVPKQPPERIVRAVRAVVDSRVRPVTGLLTAPTLRPDGTLITAAGYDESTGLYLDLSGCPPVEIPEHPGRGEVIAAVETLRYPLRDFPFAQECHRGAAIAAFLTLIGRYTFSGSVPLFLVEANRAGTGKGLLIDALIVAATGIHPASMANTTDDNEMRKRLLAVALAGDPVVKIDNVAEADALGTSALESALTAGVIEDRILGRSETARAPLTAVFFASGNNVRLSSDMPRRTCAMRLESSLENPEERPDLCEPRLLDHIRAHRGRYLSAGLTILRGWFAAGQPRQTLPNWGSFEPWSDSIRQCVTWAGIPDPYETRREMLSRSDQVSNLFRALVVNWSYLDPDNRGVTTAAILRAVEQHETDSVRLAKRDAIRTAVIELCPGRGDELPSPKSLSRRLTSLRGRVAEGLKFTGQEDRTSVISWFVRPV